jgi:hypothetical protein
MLGRHWISAAVITLCCLAVMPPMLLAADGLRADGVAQDKGGRNTVALSTGGRTLAGYCAAAAPMKPYLKRLYSPAGVQILRDSPEDHKHHHALMFALAVDGVDFWGEEAGAGRQVPRDADGTAESSRGTLSSFMQNLDWVDAQGKKLLVEKRTIHVVAGPSSRPVTLLNWTTELRTAEHIDSVKLGGDHYFGLGLRFVTSMDSGGRFFNASGKPGEVVRGSERLVAAKWCAYTAKADGKQVTAVIFDHPANPRHPNRIFTMSPPFAYLSATLNLWKEPLVMKASEMLTLNYAVAVWDGDVAADQIESVYRSWSATK